MPLRDVQTEHPLTRLLRRQHAVITRDQLVAHDRSPRAPRSRVQSGRWQTLHPGVYLTHSGPVPWTARAWGAVLAAGPDAGLSHEAAGYLHGFVRSAPRILSVTIPHDRRVRPLAGVRVRRTRREMSVDGNPPRTSQWVTAIDLADSALDDDGLIGYLCEAARHGVPVEMFRREVRARTRMRRRGLIGELITEVAAGTESPLEHRFHRDVERAHGLPRSTRQVWAEVAGMRLRADAVYDGYATRAELDGALAHPGGTTDDDVWRDNAVQIDRSEVTLRYRWSHVVGRTCECAGQLMSALRAGGWAGAARRCGPLCRLPAG